MNAEDIFEGWTKTLHLSDLPAFGRLLSEYPFERGGTIQMTLLLHDVEEDRLTTQTVFFCTDDAYALPPEDLVEDRDFVNGLRAREAVNV